MKAAFVLTSGDPLGYVAATSLLRSIRATMPDVQVTQLTDETSPMVSGVDAATRLTGCDFALFIARAYAVCGSGEWLFIDTDAVVQRDVRHVFDDDLFDVALATREGTYLAGEEGSDFMQAMPYNAGVVFSRSPAVWRHVADRIAAMPEQHRKWTGLQRALCDLVMRNDLSVRVLPSAYNYPPRSADDPVAHAAIVHYKGPWRKQLLWQRVYRETVKEGA